MTVLEDVVRRWGALFDHVERTGSATNDDGIALEKQLLAEAGQFFYSNGVPDQARMEQARRTWEGKVTVRDGVVWLAVPELIDGDGRIVETLVRAPVPGDAQR